MNITSKREEQRDGIPYLILEIDGREAVFALGTLRATFLEWYGVISLGQGWQEHIAVDIPATADGYHGDLHLPGYTDDPEVVKTVRDWYLKYQPPGHAEYHARTKPRMQGD